MHESPDLFSRIVLSIEDDRTRRRQRWRAAGVLACLVGALGAVLFAVIDINEGELLMDWWILELLTTLFLIGLALWLGPFIKRFGRSYAADVFRANPSTGKSFIVLTDVAYYLIFLSFILFTITFDLPSDWDGVVNGVQLKHEVSRVGGHRADHGAPARVQHPRPAGGRSAVHPEPTPRPGHPGARSVVTR